jgi:cell fate regulator YaaT (PSP1 superfamily)
MPDCLVRVGLLGQVGRFRSAVPLSMRRGQRVILRTARGLEIGEYLSSCDSGLVHDYASTGDGDLLRVMTPEDELLAVRLDRRRHQAFLRCESWLKERDIDAQLVDVETLFDGGAIYFYFLGDAPIASAALEQELGEEYAAQIRLTDFANLLEHGCGPACGTEEGAGCGASPGGCSSCGLATACHTKSV